MIQRLLFPAFRRFVRFNHQFSRRVTPAGRMIIMGIVVSATFGIDTEKTLSYQLFAFLALLLVMAVASLPLFRGPFAVQRILPRFATVGEPLHYEIMLDNGTRRKQRDLHILDILEDSRPGFREFQQAREPGGQNRNWFDRKVGFHRFMWLVFQKRGLESTQGRVEVLPPGGKTRVPMQAAPLRRGMVRFAAVTVARPDPFGLVRAHYTVVAPQTLLILPRRYAIPPSFQLPGGRQFQPGGASMATLVGESEEFAALRDYREGDSLRHFHWPSLAKTGKPVTRQYQEEYFTRHALILDTFAEERAGLFEEAVSIAAGFALALEQGDALLDLMFVSPNAFKLTAGRGLAHSDQMLEILANVLPRPEQQFSELTALVISHAGNLSGTVLLLTAWDLPRQDLVQRLTALNIPVFVFLIHASGAKITADTTALGAFPERFQTLEAGRIQEALAAL